MVHPPLIHSASLDGVRYEIRGPLANRALDLERQGNDIIRLNIGNPGLFGFRMPETMRKAIVENLAISDAYVHQKGIFPAREAVVMRLQNRGIMDVTAEEVIIGNGVSELIVMCMKALLNPGDEVLVPSPDYPLWTASVLMHGAKARFYGCRPENDLLPDLEEIEASITGRTRAIVVINPNNPTGAVYPPEILEGIARIAERHNLVVFADEIYDEILYDGAVFHPMAHYARKTLCCSFSGLSKIYRACGFRVGWVSFSGEVDHARGYLQAVELLAALRLCSNVPGQWAVQTALGGYQSIVDLCSPGGRLHASRQAMLQAIEASPYLTVHAPAGALYAWIGVDRDRLPGFNDEQFALDLLERRHVLVAPGSSFNVPYHDHFRITLLPDEDQLAEVFERMDEQLAEYA
ncbi:MAG: aminotransferase class I/II-fold pyridoxal phosphate-dependent enzyme [Planctomycetota bacterium]